jgi:ion channel
LQGDTEGDALAEAEEAYLTARPAAESVSAGEWGLRALLILLVVDIFIVAPIAQGATSVVQPVVHSIVLVSGIAIASRSRGTILALVGVLGVAGLVTHWTYHYHPTIVLQRADTALSLTFTAIVTGLTVLQVVRAGPITVHRIEGAVAAYLLVAYAWALAYQLVELSDPASFRFPAAVVPQTLRFHLLYFSVTTLASVGYGDITPLGPVARSLTALEGVIGQLFPVLLLARLVSMELSYRKPIGC